MNNQWNIPDLYLKNILLAGGLALGVCATIGSNAVAQPAGMRGLPPMHEMQSGPLPGGPAPWLQGLKLTEAQEDQVFRIFHDQAPAMHARMKAAQKVHRELLDLAAAPDFDRKRAQELADTAARAMADLALMAAEGMSRVREILTPEQRARLAGMRVRGPHPEWR